MGLMTILTDVCQVFMFEPFQFFTLQDLVIAWDFSFGLGCLTYVEASILD